jgi:hypothetical protein
MFTKFKKYFLVFSVFWLVSSATYSGFIAKWGLRDNDDRLGIAKMLSGTADKPFVYRQLLPTTANIIGDHAPDKLINLVGNKYAYGPIKDYASVSKLIDAPAKYKFKWLIVYWMGFVMLLGSLYLLRNILSSFGVGPVAAVFAPCLFSLCMPIIQTVGGYTYDYGELFFMSLAVYLTLKNRYIMLLLVVSLATLNKESFIFFIPALYPFLPKSSAVIKTHIFFALQLLISVCINLWIKNIYSINAGEAVEVWFFKNIQNYLNPHTYFKFEASYGMLAPKGINIMTVLLIFILISAAWKYLDSKVRNHCLIAFCINFPLFIVVGYTNEIRGLSFLYISLVFLIAHTIQHYEKKFDPLVSPG